MADRALFRRILKTMRRIAGGDFYQDGSLVIEVVSNESICCGLCMPHLIFKARGKALVQLGGEKLSQEVDHRGGNVDGRVGSHDDSHQQGKGKVVDNAPAKDKN